MQLNNDQLVMIRKVYGLSQIEFALLADVDTSFISMLEHGKRKVSEKVSRNIVNELQLTPEKLIRINEIHNEFQREVR